MWFKNVIVGVGTGFFCLFYNSSNVELRLSIWTTFISLIMNVYRQKETYSLKNRMSYMKLPSSLATMLELFVRNPRPQLTGDTRILPSFTENQSALNQGNLLTWYHSQLSAWHIQPSVEFPEIHCVVFIKFPIKSATSISRRRPIASIIINIDEYIVRIVTHRCIPLIWRIPFSLFSFISFKF